MGPIHKLLLLSLFGCLVAVNINTEYTYKYSLAVTRRWTVKLQLHLPPSSPFLLTCAPSPSLISSPRWIISVLLSIAQCVHCTVFFPFDRARWDLSSNLKPVMLLNIYLSQRTRSKGTLRKVDFREPQTLNLWFSLKYSPVVTTNYAPLFPCNSPLAMVI